MEKNAKQIIAELICNLDLIEESEQAVIEELELIDNVIHVDFVNKKVIK